MKTSYVVDDVKNAPHDPVLATDTNEIQIISPEGTKFVAEIAEGGMYGAAWTTVYIYIGEDVVSSRTIYGAFRKSRAHHLAKRMIRDARAGIIWTSV